MIRQLRNARIQAKLRNVIVISCAIIVLLTSTAYILFEYFSFRETLRNKLQTIAAVVGANSSGALAFDTPGDAYDNLAALKAEPHVVAASLYTLNGKLFAKYPDTIPDTQLPVQPGQPGFRFISNYMEGFDTIYQKNTPLGIIYLKSDLEEMYIHLRLYIYVAVIVFLLALITSYLISRILQKSISEPILLLEQTAKRISEKADYSVRAVKSGNDEIGSLTDAFNHMLTRIESQNQEIRSFNKNLEKTIAIRTKALQEANEVLKDQKEFVETIINSSIDVIGVFDKDLNYVMLNKRADDYYQFNRESVIGRNLLDVFPHIKDSDVLKHLQRALAGEPVINLKHKSSIGDRYFENYYIPLKNNVGEVYGVLTLAHDISNIMESQEKLIQLNSQLLKSNHDLEQFAYVASHDLQEPLRKIQVYSQLIGEDSANVQSVMKYHVKINQSANRMQDLIKDVLNFSRISRTEEAFEKVDLNRVIEVLKNDFELTIQESDAQIYCDPLPAVEAIPMQMSQLFHNLFSNSLKYSDKKPVIKITSVIMDDQEVINNPLLNKENKYAKITFADNGIGFEPQFNEKIFTIFQRLHGQQAYSGTGIGLALCRKIVENHHGAISARGEPGKGATFTICLPLVQTER
jgi:PAS domain S-box-containing protein